MTRLAELETRIERLEAALGGPGADAPGGALDRSVGAVIEAVAFQCGLSATEIAGEGRERQLARARFAVVWIAKKGFGFSYGQIGRRLGGRDHSTLSWAMLRAGELRNTRDPAFRMLTDKLFTHFTGEDAPCA